MPWWVWVLIGFTGLGLELLTTGIHLGFFGTGALLVGLLVGLGLGGPLWFQLLLWSIISVLQLVAFRKPLLRRLRSTSTEEVDTLVGQIALAGSTIEPSGYGRAEHRGASWKAHNVGSASIVEGQRCVIEKIDGLTLWIRSES